MAWASAALRFNAAAAVDPWLVTPKLNDARSGVASTVPSPVTVIVVPAGGVAVRPRRGCATPAIAAAASSRPATRMTFPNLFMHDIRRRPRRTSRRRFEAYAVAGRYGVQPDGILGAASLMKSVGVGARGEVWSTIPACSIVLSPLRRLHGAQAVTTFSQIDSPPFDRGTMWSSVRRPAVVPQ